MTWTALGAAVLVAAASLPAAAQPAADPTGDWRGTLHAGPADVRVALHLGAVSTFDSPDQGAIGIPAVMTRQGGHVSVTIGKASVFEGDLSADGKTLSGTLKQGSASLPLAFTRGVWSALHRAQTPVAPYPYRAEEVGYDNPASPGVHLAGTLTLPDGPGPFPAVLLITGSGAQDRDETLFAHKPFLVLADALTRRGIAVLRVDDRGVGGSTGASAQDTSLDFATDVEAGVAWLKQRPDIDRRRIGLLGHSEGGIIAPMVAAKDRSIAFLVLWAGFAVPGADLIVEQAGATAAALGAPSAAVARVRDQQGRIIQALIANPDPAAARAAMDKVRTEAGGPPLSNAEFTALNSPWYRTFVGYDPAPALRSLRIPILALVGSKDTQVTAAQNIPALTAALAGDSRAKVVELPGLNHLLQPAITGGVEEYQKIETTIDPAALKLIVDWVVEAVAKR